MIAWVDADACAALLKEVLFRAAGAKAFANELDEFLTRQSA